MTLRIVACGIRQHVAKIIIRMQKLSAFSLRNADDFFDQNAVNLTCLLKIYDDVMRLLFGKRICRAELTLRVFGGTIFRTTSCVS